MKRATVAAHQLSAIRKAHLYHRVTKEQRLLEAVGRRPALLLHRKVIS
jgi:hypothetical protein